MSMGSTLVSIALGAFASAALVLHLRRRVAWAQGLGLVVWALGVAVLTIAPMVLFAESYNGLCSTLDEDWACGRIEFVTMQALWSLVFMWPALVAWSILYSTALLVCWLAYRGLARDKSASR